MFWRCLTDVDKLILDHDGALEALVDLKVFKTNLETNGAAVGTSSSLEGNQPIEVLLLELMFLQQL